MNIPEAPKRMRKDATRNRAAVLAAADRVFSQRGLDASLEEIAADAGVGVGTVHRAFGSKNGLIDALYADSLATAAALIEDCATEPTGWGALRRVMWEITALQSRNRAMQHLLYRTADPSGRVLRDRIEPALTAVIERARREGAVRADFAATDIPLITRAISSGMATVSGYGMDLARRHLEFFFKGIAATPDERAVPRPLPDDDFALWLDTLPLR